MYTFRTLNIAASDYSAIDAEALSGTKYLDKPKMASYIQRKKRACQKANTLKLQAPDAGERWKSRALI